MRHQDLTRNHILESWVYANAAARTTATGFVSIDIGRIAYQSDTKQYWRLASTAPTWQPLEPVGVSSVDAPANPTGTTNTTGLMMGLGGSIAFTPIKSGKLMIVISGMISNSGNSNGAKTQIRYGTGAAPANGAALTGTVAGNIVSMINNANSGGLKSGFACVAIITDLTLGTAYWIDLSLAAITLGTANLTDVGAIVVEI